MPTRQQWRELARTTLTNASTYAAVYEGARRKFDGQSPVAMVLSGGMHAERIGRAQERYHYRLTATIYVRADLDGEDAAEDLLDTLVRAAEVAFIDAGFDLDASDAAPDGAPLRNIDGVFYRVERIPLRVDDQV